MIGAIAGDIIGSRFEFDNINTKDFELFNEECSFTDDTVMTIAVADAILQWDAEGRPSFGRRAHRDGHGAACHRSFCAGYISNAL